MLNIYNLESNILIIIGFLLCLVQFISVFRKYKWLFIIGIILIGIGCSLLVIGNTMTPSENYESQERDDYQQIAAGTVWTDSENDNAGLGWVL